MSESLFLDYFELKSFGAFAEKHICRKLKNFKISSFIYVFENQSWEKVCCNELRDNYIVKIGYQSSGFSERFLNFFPNELDASVDPMPNMILTVGDNFTKRLKEFGCFNVPVETFCALRMKYKMNKKQYSITSSNPYFTNNVLYAFSVHSSDYKHIVDDLVTVFKDVPIKVFLKFHPLYSAQNFKIDGQLPENFFAVQHVDMTKLSEEFDCVFFDDNSFGIESLLNGVKAFQYRSNNMPLSDRFFYFDLWNVDADISTLSKIRDQILDKVFKSNLMMKNVKYINKMYVPYTSECAHKFQNISNSVGRWKAKLGTQHANFSIIIPAYNKASHKEKRFNLFWNKHFLILKF